MGINRLTLLQTVSSFWIVSMVLNKVQWNCILNSAYAQMAFVNYHPSHVSLQETTRTIYAVL
eukprot:Awhi_evm1s2123